MQIMRLNNAQFKDAYGIQCAPIPQRGDRDGLYSTICRISKGGKTVGHSHYESEIFYIISGDGLMTINHKSENVSAGDHITIPPLAKHELCNTGTNELIFLSVYSEDNIVPTLPHSVLVTAAPPTPNGPLHIGHLSGPYLASDILARYLRLRSTAVLSHCGTDDHQNYVFEKAKTLGADVAQFRQQMRKHIIQDMQAMSVEFDEFIEPANDVGYKRRIYDFMNRAINSSVVKKENIEMPYCIDCNAILVDALVDAYCPYCKCASKGACEHCGMVVMPSDLLEVSCSRCKTKSITKSVEGYTFSLHHYLPNILDELNRLNLSQRLRCLIDQVSGIENIKILIGYTDKNNHGLCVPNSNIVPHVWFEMAAHYEQFALSNRFWMSCFGFDNAFYYLLFIPALLRANNDKTKLPDAVISNEFLLLDEQKFSTSREHVIWIKDMKGNLDYLRLYLVMNRPEKKEDNFTLSEFQIFTAKLELQLRELHQKARLVAKLQDVKVNPAVLVACNRFTRDMTFLLKPQHAELRGAGRLLHNFIDNCCQSGETDMNERLMLHTLAMVMSPFMPKESQQLFESLEEKRRNWINDWTHYYAVV